VTTVAAPTTPIAIIGIGCLFPRAADRHEFWANIVNKVDAIAGVPPTHWRPDDYFNTDAKAPDMTYARRGGFLSAVDFPPLDFGISPNSLEATDSTQLLGLMVAKQALEDAGYGVGREFDRSRTSVILGVTGTLPLVIPLGARLGHPHWRRALKEAGVPDDLADKVTQRIADSYVGWQEDSFPGLLGNVVAGRIANRLDLGGTNCVVDAACASSLSALHLAMYELATGRADMVLTGGMDTFNDIFMYMCFSKTPALSPTGNAKPFDAAADGTILGEGLGCLAIKRLADAERAGDRIYAVIRGIGTSSDGKGNAIYAPSPAGQTRALRQAYRLADVTPDTIELVEAHGTGTRAGDTAEATALAEVYRSAQPSGSWCAVGSIKSQIGHTKAAAGAAGLIKAALALHHKVLPPTIKVEQPVEPLTPGRSPLYVNTEQRPWLPRAEHPRRAAVSSFGFGGSNFHCVLEEYRPQKERIDWDGQTQIVAFSAETPETLDAALSGLSAAEPWEEFRRAAARSRAAFRRDHQYRLVMVIEKDRSDLAKLLSAAGEAVQKLGDKISATTPDGISVGKGVPAGKLAFVFPGQGSQYVDMLRDLACRFPPMQQALAEADAVFAEGAKAETRLSDCIYPQPVFAEKDRVQNDEALRATNVAQPALGAVGLGVFRVLAHFGIRPDAVAGHSYGELLALHASGRIDAPTLHRLSGLRGRLMAEGAGDRGGMLAVQASADVIEKVLREERLPLNVANRNAPRQSVLSGATAEIRRAADAFSRLRIPAKVLSVAAAFHSPLVAGVRHAFHKLLDGVSFALAEVPIFSNTTAQVYPTSEADVRTLLAAQLAEPVAFVEQIDNMYRAGARTFLEVGPGKKLTGLVDAILEGRDHAAVAVDASSGQRGGIADLARALAQLAALGHPVDLTRWDDAIDPKAELPKKPALTVPICGANYVKPKPPAPAAALPIQQREPRPETKPRKPESVEQTVIPNDPLPAKARCSPTAAAAVPVVAPAALSQALRVTQENLVALQKLGEQTAELHGQFLENQNRALQAFQTLLDRQHQLLQGQSATVPAPVIVAPSLPSAAPTGRAPAIPAPLPAIPAPAPKVQAPSPKPAPSPEPAPVTKVDNNQTTNLLLAIVAEKTGYPVEMLGLDMELDADLGIDSIKRVEILSAVQEKLPAAPVIKPEHLGSMRTLRQVVDFLVNSGPTPGPTPTATPAAPPPVEPAGADITRILLEVVAEKTGYPAEMIGLDMELDADLGIDSIKRVEIFSAVQEKLPEAPTIKPEQLGAMRTLRQVIEFLGKAESAPSPPISTPAPAQPLSTPVSTPSVPQPPLKRYVLDKADLPSTDRRAITLAKTNEIWITEDGRGLASLLVGRLGLLGYRARLIDWKELSSLGRPAAQSGLVILAPTTATDRFLSDAFALLQLAGPGLRQGAKQGGAVFVTVSRLDGAFGLSDTSGADALSGGLAGLSKTTSHEWPEVHCKAIDLAAGTGDPEEAALAIVDEMFLAGPAEVGLENSKRCTLKLVERSWDSASTAAPFERGDVVVISGGARGVTAEVGVALARAFAPKLVLLGRSPEPKSEPAWLVPLRTETEIRQALIKETGHPTSPREIGEQCRFWLANREVLRTLERVKAAGAEAVYRSVDVRDAAAVQDALGEVRSRFGPIKGLVHGAGVLADRRIEDKTREQFDAVYETKVVGLRSLLAAVEGDPLKVLALFSSSTGRFGRTAQIDYAVANEALNKVAQQEARRRPDCRVVSLNWGPWDGGMVTPALKDVFRNEGIGVISLAAGADFFVREIVAKDSPVEVVVLAGDGLFERPETDTAATSASLAPAFERSLSLDQFPVLRSHVLAHRAVLPMALTMELLAHAALHGNPGLVFHGLDDLRVLKGVRLAEDQSCRLRVLAGKAVRKDGMLLVPAELHSMSPEGRDLAHARATAVLVTRVPKASEAPPDLGFDRYDREIAEVYRDLLFHGPDLQGIRQIDGLSVQGLTAWSAAAPPPSAWIKQPLRGTWLADPLALDVAFQLMSLWSFENYGAFSLPSFAGCYRQYRRSFPADGVRITAVVKEHSPHRATVDIWFSDRAGELVAQINGYECVIDASLNQAFRHNQLSSEVLPSA
jgi:acyl transferase domain-containing protein/NAD(P)-dependent dehydrogenase (short-subunit alcohol dehydrogenase family)